MLSRGAVCGVAVRKVVPDRFGLHVRGAVAFRICRTRPPLFAMRRARIAQFNGPIIIRVMMSLTIPQRALRRSLLPALVLGISVLACSYEPATEQEALAGAASSTEGSGPVIVGKRYDIRVEDAGYSPEKLLVKVGEEATLVFTRVTWGTCGKTVVIPQLEVKEDQPYNEPVAVSFRPTQAGEIGFACGMDMMKGTIVVTQ
jgi:plastocyanin